MTGRFDGPGWDPAEFLRAAMRGSRGDPHDTTDEEAHEGRRGRHRGRRFGPGEGFPFGPGPGRGFGGFAGFGGIPFVDPRQWPGWEGRGQRARRGDVRMAALALLAE